MSLKLKSLFANYTLMLEKSIQQLTFSFQKREHLPAQFSEEEALEILTSRFARTADLYTQKLMKLLFRLLQEPDLTFIDQCQVLEKLGLVDQAQDLYQIRVLRNQIAHEYALDNLALIHAQVIEKTPALIQLIQVTLTYITSLIAKMETP